MQLVFGNNWYFCRINPFRKALTPTIQCTKLELWTARHKWNEPKSFILLFCTLWRWSIKGFMLIVIISSIIPNLLPLISSRYNYVLLIFELHYSNLWTLQWTLPPLMFYLSHSCILLTLNFCSEWFSPFLSHPNKSTFLDWLVSILFVLESVVWVGPSCVGSLLATGSYFVALLFLASTTFSLLQDLHCKPNAIISQFIFEINPTHYIHHCWF